MTQEQQTQEENISIGTKINQEVTCSQCGKKGNTSEFFSYAVKEGPDVHLCSDCKQLVNSQLGEETQNPNLVLAIGAGVIAGVIGSIAWYYLTIITGYEFGYASLGLGYMVGFAVYFGAGKKRGEQLQILAAVLTVVTIFVGEYAIFNHSVNDYIQGHLSEYPDFGPGDKASISIFNPEFLKSFASPISLVIYSVGVYIAYRFPKPRSI